MTLRVGAAWLPSALLLLQVLVTLDSLTEEDEGTYTCGIDIPLDLDPMFQVKVSVFPAPTETPSTKVFTSNLGPASSLPATTWPSMTRQDTPDPRQHPRSLLSDVHFLLLVFLELPLLLSMLSAVLWVNRPQKSSGRRGNQADYENQ
ncbi:CMRF35-like molecule 6 isoform X2 [Rhinolophus sinicus]|uniref:CMRF35-like molecule 6 isoform X2 n=1 Tax=Rhinolophus sinicus TaxID=89399 RepID=UPI003D7AA6A1